MFSNPDDVQLENTPNAHSNESILQSIDLLLTMGIFGWLGFELIDLSRENKTISVRMSCPQDDSTTCEQVVLILY